jgi:hypothetical protein
VSNCCTRPAVADYRRSSLVKVVDSSGQRDTPAAPQRGIAVIAPELIRVTGEDARGEECGVARHGVPNWAMLIRALLGGTAWLRRSSYASGRLAQEVQP